MKTPEDFKILKYDKEKFKKTGVLDCFQDVNLSKMNLSQLPFKFGKIDGYFNCSNNQLNSLEGSPESIKRYLNCENNKINSLLFFPKLIMGNIYIKKNNLDIFNWILLLQTFPNKFLQFQCKLVQDNSTFESTINSLKMKQKIISLINS